MKVLKCLMVLTVVAGVFATSAAAVEPIPSQMKFAAENPQLNQTGPPGPPLFFSDACPATDVGMLASDGSITIPGDTCSSTNDYENDGPDCSYGAGGNDEIFQFTVDQTGVWQIDTFNICAGWDTSLMVREETGGGCPGDFHSCDGDSGHPFCGAFESALVTFLATGTTYYLVVDGWSPGTCGTFEVVAFLVAAACTTDADCDDGAFCNGAETCNVATGECVDGTPPCAFFQSCDEDADVCIDPDSCLSWLGGVRGTTFFPYDNWTGGAWMVDDVELERACTDDPVVLESYTIPLIARNIQNPVGTQYFIDTALWTVKDDGTCEPGAIIPGTECLGLANNIDAGGSPSDIFFCSAPGVVLPDNSGNINKCEVDFFIGFRGNDLGVGAGIASSEQIIGEVGLQDDFGVNIWWAEINPGFADWDVIWFGDDVNTPADFENTEVCTINLGVCCVGLDSCTEDVTQAECDALGSVFIPCLFWDVPSCADPDGDGLFTICGDNCPGVDNPGQEDCDGGMTPEGDACETDPDFLDADDDGFCNGDEECDNDPDKQDPGICGCGVADVDTDGDGALDCEEECDFDPNKTAEGQCGCGTPDIDSDGDGVADCNDECPGVDDAVFAPGCVDAIPTVSEWGLVILALLLLAGGKIYFGRRAAMS